MSLKTIYCVQPYWRDGMKLAHGELRQFKTRLEALRAADKAYERHAGVLVYKVAGDPDFESWGSPRLVRRIGAVPRIEF